MVGQAGTWLSNVGHVGRISRRGHRNQKAMMYLVDGLEHFFMVSLWWNEWLIMVSNWNNHISGWWFGTWILFSIIYMGCHPSHWLSYFWRWLKPPTRFTIYYRIWPYIMQNRTVAILFIIGGGLQNVYKKWFKREHSIFHGFFTLWYIYIYTQCIYIYVFKGIFWDIDYCSQCFAAVHIVQSQSLSKIGGQPSTTLRY